MTKRIERNPIKCIICGDEFLPRDYRCIVCMKPDCRRAYSRLRYKKDTTSCVCSRCGVEYNATRQQKKDLCHDCAYQYEKTFKETYIQNIVCRQCGKVLGTRIKNKTREPLINSEETTCDECKLKNKEASSIRMKLNNPRYHGNKFTSQEYEEYIKRKQEYFHERKRKKNLIGGLIKKGRCSKYTVKSIRMSKEKRKTPEQIQETRKMVSEKMKTNNPMFRQDVRKKVSETFRRKLNSGELKYKNGSDAPSWKGGRSRTPRGYVRSSLHRWRKDLILKSNHCCQMCGKYAVFINVHHIFPFRDIVELAEKETGIDLDKTIFRSEDYNIIEDWIIRYHETHDVGIVLCEDCHSLVDKGFHKPNRNKEKFDEN